MRFIKIHFTDDIIYGASRVFNFRNAFWKLPSILFYKIKLVCKLPTFKVKPSKKIQQRMNTKILRVYA